MFEMVIEDSAISGFEAGVSNEELCEILGTDEGPLLDNPQGLVR